MATGEVMAMSMTVKDRLTTLGVLAAIAVWTGIAFVLGMFTEWCIHHG